jgi:hypothetical protein
MRVVWQAAGGGSMTKRANRRDVGKHTPPKVDVARYERCNAALHRTQVPVNRGLELDMRRDLKAFATEHGRDILEHSLSRYMRNVPRGGGNDDLVADWIETRMPKLLKEKKCDRKLVADVETLLRSGSFRGKKQTGTDEQLHDAIAKLFKMSESEYYVSENPPIENEYFGYRRSAHHGDIIRFYIKIWYDAATRLVKIYNLYCRRDQPWKVEGTGFNVGETSYLFGHAVSDDKYEQGLGLRVFSLVTYGRFSWYVGPLISMDYQSRPIAARVLLIPAKQHRQYTSVPEKHRHEKVRAMIEEQVSPEILDRDIELGESAGTFDIKCSIRIQAAIFNGTFTTIQARPDTIDKEQIPRYEALFAFQERAVMLSRDLQGSMLPFLRIAGHAEEIIAIDNKRSPYLRRK